MLWEGFVKSLVCIFLCGLCIFHFRLSIPYLSIQRLSCFSGFGLNLSRTLHHTSLNLSLKDLIGMWFALFYCLLSAFLELHWHGLYPNLRIEDHIYLFFSKAVTIVKFSSSSVSICIVLVSADIGLAVQFYGISELLQCRSKIQAAVTHCPSHSGQWQDAWGSGSRHCQWAVNDGQWRGIIGILGTKACWGREGSSVTSDRIPHFLHTGSYPSFVAHWILSPIFAHLILPPPFFTLPHPLALFGLK